MKNNIKLVSLFIFVLILGLQSCKPKIKQDTYQTKDLEALVTKLDSLINLNTEESKANIQIELAKMLKSPDEAVIVKSFDYFYSVGDTITDIDSISNSLIKRFPKGASARFAEYQKIWGNETVEAKKKAYNKLILDFPPNTFSANDKGLYNIVLQSIAEDYIKDGKITEAEKTISEFVKEPQIAFSYYNIASNFYGLKNKEKTYLYIDKALKASEQALQEKGLSKQIKKNIEYRIQDILRLYAIALYEDGKYTQAIPYFEEFKIKSEGKDDEALFKYVETLKALHKTKDAIHIIEYMITKDFGSQEEYTLLKELFTMQNGHLKGYTKLKDKLEKEVLNKLSEKIKSSIINEPAPEVSFKTMDGKVVSLNSLKGKILVIDFWATWCGPCKASFPAMKNLINHYKEENIKFLFLNTLESSTGSDRVTAIQKVLKKYDCENFEVLLDTPENNNFKGAKAFDVKAIPLKIFIDKNGNIRYKSLGYDGDIQSEENKMKTIINIIKEL